ncbi:MAG: ndh1, partial [Rhizobacter sp.]|nr:ndh1 [Rhizobacter sp.]
LLGDALGRHRSAEIVLVDHTMAHMWKPLLHEVAAGTLPSQENEVSFLQQAQRHHFRFHLGTLDKVDRARREVHLLPLIDDEHREVAPQRTVGYDTLVVALGSIVNDFGTPGVAQHAMTLDDADDARRFHQRLLSACAGAALSDEEAVDIVIVGGGATGVELAAELSEAGAEIANFGDPLRHRLQPLRLHLVEAGPRLVAALPEDMAVHVRKDLLERGIEVRLSERVVGVTADRVLLASGSSLPSVITVWAAGIQGPAVLERLDALELNRQRQLVVRATLQSTRDESVFAFGDCASCVPVEGGPPVPARAQAAHQQAQFLVKSLRRRLAGQPLPSFVFHDRGSLVSLGQHDAVGRIVGGLTGRSFAVQGFLARLGYWFTQRQYLIALHGPVRTLLTTIGSWLLRRTQPRVKLH